VEFPVSVLWQSTILATVLLKHLPWCQNWCCRCISDVLVKKDCPRANRLITLIMLQV